MAIPNGTGGYQLGDGNIGEPSIYNQGNPATYAVGATMTAADVNSGIINFTGASANLQLPATTDLEAVVNIAKSNFAYAFSLMATGAGTATVVVNAGWTLVGSNIVANGTSGRFAMRKTAPQVWSLYRLS